jgi:hypothetical protein
MSVGFEWISQPFYNGRVGATLSKDLLVDEAFDRSRIGPPVDRAGLPGSVEERSGEWVPWKFI